MPLAGPSYSIEDTSRFGPAEHRHHGIVITHRGPILAADHVAALQQARPSLRHKQAIAVVGNIRKSSVAQRRCERRIRMLMLPAIQEPKLIPQSLLDLLVRGGRDPLFGRVASADVQVEVATQHERAAFAIVLDLWRRKRSTRLDNADCGLIMCVILSVIGRVFVEVSCLRCRGNG